MTAYYSSFTSGLSGAVKYALTQQLNDVEIDLLLDGLILYRSDRPIQQIKQIRFFNNTFLLLHLFKRLHPDSIPYMMQAVFKKPETINAPRWALKGKAFFRIMASKENQTVSIDRDTLERLEKFFSYKLGLKVHRSRPDVEVWFLERSEGFGFVGIRITQPSAAEKDLQRGELKSELAHMLCLIAEPGKSDVFLDPFAGSGAIPIERARLSAYQEIIASDNDLNAVQQLRGKISKSSFKIAVREWDALNLQEVGDHSIDRIVTDPPWGIFTAQEATALDDLFSGMLREFSRILKDSGIAVILMGQKDLFENSLKGCPALELVEKNDILVSGKKAAIYKLRKRPS